ncbi:unnamed protein product [Plasmodium vivax]|uniref:(malaria parasite P. vivax) hypothetical protein n=1 Tax=Plasmodium vivax TaxID=5855 RepID=A0A8S4H584_PLAVI|nr:unnamed protein product [Plasmodium vivax]
MRTPNYNIVEQFSGCKGFLDMINNSVGKNNYTDLCRTTVVDKMHLDQRYVDVCSVFKAALQLFSGGTGGYEKNIYCGFMNYWLNEQLSSLKNSTYDSNTFYTTMINNDAVNSAILNKCKEEIYNMEESEFNDMNLLNNMYEKLNEYKSNMRKNPSEACKNAKVCSSLYNSIISKCVEEKTSSLCNELSNINSKIKNEGWMKKGNYVCNDIEPLLSAEVAFVMNGKNKNTFLIHIVSISTIVAGMVLIFLLFYKFSTFGIWLNKTVLKKNKYRYNLYEEEKNGLLERKFEQSNMNFKNIPYITAYSPVQV